MTQIETERSWNKETEKNKMKDTETDKVTFGQRL
jgi:hypothetical protein